jgi:hypothetical protein
MHKLIFLLALLVGPAGCESKQPKTTTVDIELSNNSINALDQVELVWQGPYVPGGILSPGISSTALGVEWPNLASAKLTFIDKTTRTPYTIELSFPEINQKALSGKCHDVTIRILSYDKAEVVCK